MADGPPGRTVTLPFIPSLLAWSDDGARLVAGGNFASFVDAGTPGLAVIDTGRGTVAWRLDGLSCPAAVVAGSRVAVCLFRSTPEGGVFSAPYVAAHDLITGDEVWRRDDVSGAHLTVRPGGRILVVSTFDHHYRLLDLETGGDLAKVEIQPMAGFRPVISPAGRQVAVADATRVMIADVSTGTILHEIPVSRAPLIAAFDDTGDTLTTVDLDPVVTVVDTVSGEIISRSPLADAHLVNNAPGFQARAGRPVALSPDRRIVAVAGTRGTVTYAARTGVRIGALPGTNTAMVRTAFSPDGRTVAVTRPQGGDEVVTAPVPLVVWQQKSDARATAAFDRTGRLAVAHKAGDQGVVQYDAVAEGPLLEMAVGAAAAPPAIRDVDVTGAGIRLVLSAASDQAARLHSGSGGELLFERPHPGPLTGVAFLRGGGGFVTACTDGGVRLFDTVSGERRWLVTHTGPVNAVAAAGDVVCSVGSDKTVRCLEIVSGAERWRATLSSAVTRAAASSDARFVVVACADRTVRLLEMANGAERWPVPARHDGRINALAAGPDGATVATACEDGSVRVIAAESGAVIRTVGHVRPPVALAYSADGLTLFSGSLDGAVLAISVSDPAAPPAELTRAASPITRIVPGDAGASVAVAGEDGLVRVLDLGLRTELVRFLHDSPVQDIAVDAGNGLLVTGDGDGVIRVWAWPSNGSKRRMS